MSLPIRAGEHACGIYAVRAQTRVTFHFVADDDDKNSDIAGNDDNDNDDDDDDADDDDNDDNDDRDGNNDNKDPRHRSHHAS
uniref:Uncharacterized protein n=1 Tax=Glossina morsitans morsitans TaxID=37546 RepID=A0A1B0G956_GLOMM